MSVASIANQSTNATTTSKSSSSYSTASTSNDATTLREKKSQIQNEIQQLQSSGGSSAEIQKLNKYLTDVDNKITKVGKSSSPQSSDKAQSNSNSKSLDSNVGTEMNVTA
jgi:hypothetical protein